MIRQSPNNVVNVAAITGLAAGENILGIDFRPATGQLYALGSSSRIYIINPRTGVATAVGAAGAFTLMGTDFGFDFNPTVDRIRIVSNTGQNLRVNPNDGTLDWYRHQSQSGDTGCHGYRLHQQFCRCDYDHAIRH
ncbi:MAG: DUF4394 domain-containing protein [Pyrinomonadaceae bacterium]